MTLILKYIAEAMLYLLCVAGTIFLLGAAYGFYATMTAKKFWDSRGVK